MADSAVNYPDILGLITGGARVNLGVVQAALAVRPRITRAGRPFEVMLLLQNAADVDVDVVATLSLPEQDARKQRGRFITQKARLRIGLAPAEVGFAIMPVTTLADVAMGDDYRITIEIEPKALGKPQRIRATEGGGAVDLAALPSGAGAHIEALRMLDWAAQKKLGRPVLEVPFSVMMGRLGQIPNFKPDWVSIARLNDYADARPLLARHRDLLLTQVFPHLRRSDSYKLLLDETTVRFQAAGFPLDPVEAVLIAKLMTLVLEYAAPEASDSDPLLRELCSVQPLLDDPLRLAAPARLPHWVAALLPLLEREPRATGQPAQFVSGLLYEALLHDAVQLAFALLVREPDEDWSGLVQQQSHTNALLAALHAKHGLTFAHIYLPLVAGGILINEEMPASKETPAQLLAGVANTLERRRGELDEALLPLYDMTLHLIDRAGQKYGFRL